MAKNLEALKTKKRSLTTSLTKTLTFLEDKKQNSEDITVYDITVRMKRVDRLICELQDTYDKISNFEEVDDEEREQVEISALKAEALCLELQDILKGKNNISVKQSSVNKSIKLPEIDLPKFSGDYESWLRFKDTFKVLIHNNDDLSDTQKYYYLISCLTGIAAQIISSLEINSENYTRAWDLLQTRFENNKIIIYCHVRAIFELNVITKENYHALRNLIDEFLKRKVALEALREPVQYWDTLLIYILTSKLDNGTRKAWESSLCDDKMPTLTQLIDFLNNKCRILETVSYKNVSFEKLKVSNFAVRKTVSCPVCKGEHFINKCNTFLKLSFDNRKQKVREFNLCLNCLKPNHLAKNCHGSNCEICGYKHHKLLHFKKPAQQAASQEVRNIVSEGLNPVINTHCSSGVTHVFLTTAVVNVKSVDNKNISVRALLDTGSDSNFISSYMYNKLGLNDKRSIRAEITGIGMKASKINEVTQLTLNSVNTNFKMQSDFLIIDKITTRIPTIGLDISSCEIPVNIKLADPRFYEPSDIDMLIGAGIFYNLLKTGVISLGQGKPILRNSVLGWLVTGVINTSDKVVSRNCNLSVKKSENNLDIQLRKFWELEDISEREYKTRDDVECELNFVNNFERTDQGSFIVHLPLKDNAELGESKQTALKRFHNLEIRLDRSPDIKQQYIEFMRDYIELGHMQKVNFDVKNVMPKNCLNYYIPHHPVLKESSSTTKLRVVFDASAKTTNGKSLNDILRVGPTIQNELIDILLRFRTYNVVMIGDLEKMYRMVYVSDKFKDLQKIFWRENKEQPLEEYKLNTLTYGTAPAAFLATRVLKQIAVESSEQYPAAAQIIENDFYIDDLISGGSSVVEVIELKNVIANILRSGGFNLRKFGSNDAAVLKDCVDSSQDKHMLRNMTEEKTLGIVWDSQADILKYNFKCQFNSVVTKRTILSDISKIFDPLGLVAPVIIPCKILMQTLWVKGLGWDEIVPIEIVAEWSRIKVEMEKLNTIFIPRIVLLKRYSVVEIHGFCDSSEKAYGCAVYVKSVNNNGEVNVSLFCSKSKVAPVKKITLPRLELCGAVLLTKLIRRIKERIRLKINHVHFWTDSTIVLSWLNTAPYDLKTFVANRVATIQEYSESKQWHHVKGMENPADIVSRGVTVSDLLKSSWFNGPQFLNTSDLHYEPFSKFPYIDKTEFKTNLAATEATRSVFDILNRYSNFNKLKRVVAWCKRFINNCSNKCKKKHERFLTIQELDDALVIIINLVQGECFSTEIKSLKALQYVSNKSPLLRLNCFLDKNYILRVGGRLRHASLNYEAKHQIILPRRHKVTELIIRAEHERLLHAGPQLVLASIRERFWPLGGRNTIRQIIRKCVICFKTKPTMNTPLMGALPFDRINPVRPLSIIALDYCGPFLIKSSKLRNRTFIKAYVCVFVCFVTKAVHLELVTELTTESFLGMFKRFIGRRGVPSKIISDNASNFVGAFNEIKKIRNDLFKINNDDEFRMYLANNCVEWKMIPSRSPHMGGLHEAAVKSAKTLLKRVMNNQHFTYENFYTILCQIEGILNSRPLIPLTEDPSDFSVLTPGHFLIGQSLSSLPERNYLDKQPSKLNVYRQQQHLVQQFWLQWQKHYLHTLQQRSKWFKKTENLVLGQLVLLQEKDLPVRQWRLARIVELHPGPDEVLRVVTVQTANGHTTRRAVHNVCPLPTEN